MHLLTESKINMIPTRFKILPVGVESKNAIGARCTLCSMLVNSFWAVRSPVIATSMARSSTHSELPTVSSV